MQRSFHRGKLFAAAILLFDSIGADKVLHPIEGRLRPVKNVRLIGEPEDVGIVVARYSE
jgi:hypothetical protein